MHLAKLRQVGGSVMLAIPPALLDQLQLSVRSDVGLAIEGRRLVVEPKESRPRYRLDELLAECDAHAPMPEADYDWTAGGPVGEEII
jgi:antitoxin ChpS